MKGVVQDAGIDVDQVGGYESSEGQESWTRSPLKNADLLKEAS